MLHGYHIEDGPALTIHQNVYVNVTYSKNQNVYVNVTWLSCRRWTGINNLSKCLQAYVIVTHKESICLLHGFSVSGR
jgi:hypothetical protein